MGKSELALYMSPHVKKPQLLAQTQLILRHMKMVTSVDGSMKRSLFLPCLVVSSTLELTGFVVQAGRSQHGGDKTMRRKILRIAS